MNLKSIIIIAYALQIHLERGWVLLLWQQWRNLPFKILTYYIPPDALEFKYAIESQVLKNYGIKLIWTFLWVPALSHSANFKE